MKVAIYVRVSTTQQDYDRQIADLTRYAQNNGLEVVYLFKEKESGFDDSRPELAQLLKLTKNEIDRILVWEFSRLSRRAIKMQQIVQDFVEKGVSIYSYKDGYCTHNAEGKVNGMIMAMIAFAAYMAEEEAKTMQIRMQNGKAYKIANGASYVSAKIYGYDLDANKALTINEEEADVVRRIYDLCVEGYSIVRITQLLNAEGTSRPVGKKDKKAKNPDLSWRISTVQKILTNTTYKGYNFARTWEKQPKDKSKRKKQSELQMLSETRVTTPAIVSEEVWEKAQKMLQSRNSRSESTANRPEALLRGLITCAYCGHKYTRKNDHERHFYSCIGHSNAEYKGCKSPDIYCSTLDFMIWDLVTSVFGQNISEEKKNQIANPLRLKLLDKCEERELYSTRLEDVKQKAKKAARMAMMFIDDEEAFNEAKKKVDQLNEEKRQLQNEVDRIFFEIADIEDRLDNIENANNIVISTDSEKRETVKSLIENITIRRIDDDKPRSRERLIQVFFINGMVYDILMNYDFKTRKNIFSFFEHGTPIDQIPPFKVVSKDDEE